MQTFNTFPSIDIRTSWGKSKEYNPILDEHNFYLYASGRAALFHGISCLPFQARKRILIPAYHCGVEVEAVLRAGFSVKFYPLKKNLEIDFFRLEEIIDEDCGALLVVHYYGFPQPIDQLISLCRRKELFLIEDCAHSLYSRFRNKWLGQYGDIAVFSMQKTIALPNGGGLLINHNDFSNPERGEPYMDLALFKSAVRSILEFEIFHKTKVGKISKILLDTYTREHVNTTEISENSSDPVEKPSYYDVPRYNYSNRIFFMSKSFLKQMPFADIIRRRRENYQFLLSNIAFNDDFEMIHDKLPDDVCPLCLPVKVDSSDKWSSYLKQNGINVFVFGRFCHPLLNQQDFPDLSFFRERILGLPVHQQLTKKDIKKLTDKINEVICQI